MRNLFVIAPDDHNLRPLEDVARQHRCRFRGVLDFGELQVDGHFPFQQPLDRATAELDRFTGSIDGIMGYWDFPVTSMLPLLRARYGCAGPSLEAVVRCEHKFWSRRLQAEVAPDNVPRFTAVDPFDDEALVSLERQLGYPFWIKPIKAHSSQLGFRVEGVADLVRAVQAIRAGIGGFGGPFDEVLDELDLPPEIARVRGGHCVVESIIGGHQCTLEGYVHRGEVHIPIIVDSIRVEGGSSFARYQYPSRLPENVQARMRDITSRVMRHHGYDEATFNVELFWDERRDHLWLLEVNPRASQSHTVITEMVDGVPHLEAMMSLALGDDPLARERCQGRHAVAAKTFLRSRRDALVRRVPTQSEVKRIEQAFDVHVQVEAVAGRRLSQLINQDSYSYVLAAIHVGGESEEALIDTYRRVVAALRFDLEEGLEAQPQSVP